MPSFTALGKYFLFGTKFSRNEGLILFLISKVYYLTVILIFLVVTLVVTARFLVIITGYCLLPGGYRSLLVVTARYRLLLLVPTFSMNVEPLLMAFARNKA